MNMNDEFISSSKLLIYYDQLLMWSNPYKRQSTHTSCTVRYQFSALYNSRVWIVVYRYGFGLQVDQISNQ